jgi:hypothetical protein
VLRIHAARALGGCGGAAALDALAPHAASGDCRNGLTGVAIDAVRRVGERVAAARAEAARILAGGFPPPAAPGDAAAAACRALVERLHGALQALTGRQVPLPERYDAAARAALVRAFGGR